MALCEKCETPYDPPTVRSRWCSTPCRRSWHRAKARAERAARPARICSRDGCEVDIRHRRPQAKWCSTRCSDAVRRPRKPKSEHRRGGTQGPRPGARVCKPGDTFGELTFVEYVESDRNGSRAIFTCACGAEDVELAVRNVRSGCTTRCSRPGHVSHLGAEQLTINGWHHRLVEILGPAREVPCRACGATGSSQWAYTHASYAARVQLSGPDKGQAFTVDPKDYAAFCRACHARWDALHRRLAPRNGAVSGLHVLLAELQEPDPDISPTP